MDQLKISQLAEGLRQFGFSSNDAKSYIALLKCQPASAYEVAKQAGIPTSKIYETMSRLTTRGVTQTRQDIAGNLQYYAMSPADLMQTIKNSTIVETTRLQNELEKVPTDDRSNLIWPLMDESQVQSRTLSLINESRDTLLVSLWPEELSWCRQSLKEADDRRVRIALVHFGAPKISIGATYHHPAEKTLYAEKGGRGLTVVGDSREVVIANYKDTGEIDGAWSRNPSFVTVAEDYVKHDVYITKVTKFLGAEMVARFGDDYRQLRNVFDANA